MCIRDRVSTQSTWEYYMVLLVLDPSAGNQQIKYDFKKETNLTSAMQKILPMFNVLREDFGRFVLQVPSSRKFIEKVDEIWDMKDEEKIIVRSVAEESKASLKDLNEIMNVLSGTSSSLGDEKLGVFAAQLQTLYRNFRQSEEFAEDCARQAALDKLLQIALVGGSQSIQVYAMQAYSYALAYGMAGIEYIKKNLDGTITLFELLSREGLHAVVLCILLAISEEVPKAYDFLMKAAKRTSLIQERAPFSEFIDLLKQDNVEIKTLVVQFINSLMKHAPNDRMLCKFLSQMENLNLYEYLQEASTLPSADLHTQISQFQSLAKVVIKSTKFENEALKNRVKELTHHNEKLEEKLTTFLQQQNLFEIMKDDFHSFQNLAKISIEKATLYTPFIPYNHYKTEQLKSLPDLRKKRGGSQKCHRQWICLIKKVANNN
eukprot:TRINITY_DN3949_c0_g1_i3.p1 TRINITY_DN3949_c0_g1~~TRINITY_DN3949_c0_g1_i3.p1  ORF type:complete len:432 (-),score=74.26 TRINITY_DN3949_c0_g1_i3:304-1599(-)